MSKSLSKALDRQNIDTDSVKAAYARWASAYDFTFGHFFQPGRKAAATIVNAKSGALLELGVGTGLSLAFYDEHLRVTGIDLSRPMLDKARLLVELSKFSHVQALDEMDATMLSYPDSCFDMATAQYVITTIPDPQAALDELVRVVKPGGDIVIVNHFRSHDGILAWLEKALTPIARYLGWNPVFDERRITSHNNLSLVFRRRLKPLGIFTLLHFKVVD